MATRPWAWSGSGCPRRCSSPASRSSISVLIALPIGVLAAVMKGTRWDTAAKIVALLGQSLPASGWGSC